jgi:hypothetical protein
MPATWKKLAFDDETVKHSIVTAANDFLVASGSGVVVNKTLAQTKTILGLPAPDFLVIQVFS